VDALATAWPHPSAPGRSAVTPFSTSLVLNCLFLAAAKKGLGVVQSAVAHAVVAAVKHRNRQQGSRKRSPSLFQYTFAVRWARWCCCSSGGLNLSSSLCRQLWFGVAWAWACKASPPQPQKGTLFKSVGP